MVSNFLHTLSRMQVIIYIYAEVKMKKHSEGDFKNSHFSDEQKDIEEELDTADKMAEEIKIRYLHEDIFSKLRATVNK